MPDPMAYQLLGRLHPLLVHLPIGILIAAFLLELYVRSKGGRKLRRGVRLLLFWGALGAVASAVTGYLLAQEGGYEEVILATHQKGGIATAVLACVAYLQRRFTWSLSKSTHRSVSTLLITCLVILMTLTGHQGGMLTHGEDFLQPSALDSAVLAVTSIRKYTGPAGDAKVYEDLIRPLLDEKCVGCHGSRKQKGKLRLDDLNGIQAGGKHGHMLEPVKGELVRRILLPIEEKDHMPPEEKPQLTSSEMDILQAWINSGAEEGARVADYPDQKVFITYVEQLKSSPSSEPLPEFPAPDEAVVLKIRSMGALVVPVAAESNALEVNLTFLKQIPEELVSTLHELAPQIIRLRLSGCDIIDDDLQWVATLGELRVLFLDHTGISDTGVKKLASLKNLQQLNLVDTRVTTEVLPALGDIPSLRKVYLFGVQLDRKQLLDFKSLHPILEIDTGNAILKHLSSDTVVYHRK
ncbi:MAG: hypothetical protein JST46_09730 [Bacteroidetes bacterium]|nr:hypothetical protein [Bacteroidota bacterium]